MQIFITGLRKNAREDFFCDQNCGPTIIGIKYEILMDLRGFSTFAFTLTVLILVDCPVTYDSKRYCLTPQIEKIPPKKPSPPLKKFKFVEKTFFTEKY